ncbi:MAG: HAMP domain-containing sensor histidine kinase [Elusimicrobiaceae bacterium]|nr:HAMP domain-containing sensor histidine kinase [Elusimicrobiaceae bacterium]
MFGKLKSLLSLPELSLRTQVTIGAIVYAALLLTVFTGIILRFQQENYRSRAMQSAKELASEFSQSLYQKWVLSDSQDVNRKKLAEYIMLSNTAFRDKDVVYAAFQTPVNTIGYVLKSLPEYVWMMHLTKIDPYTERVLRSAGEARREFSSYPEGTVTEYMSIVYDREKRFLGTVRIGISEKLVQESIVSLTRATIIKIILLNLLAISLLAALVYYMSAKLENRLAGIQQQTRRMLDRKQSGGNSRNVFSQLTRELSEIEEMLNSLRQRFMELVTTISHEFRSPMQAIKGYAEFLSKGAAGPVNAEQVRYLEIIAENAERFQSFIDNVLDLVKLGGGNFPLAKRHFQVEDIIIKAVGFYAKQAEKAGVQLKTSVQSPGMTAYGDPDRTFQVFINLMSNALKFTPARGVVSVGAEKDGCKIIFFVRDTGPGIPASKQERLFTEFYQVPGITPQRGYKGLGIGLALCKKLTEIQGGAIAVESRPDSGTAFVFTLPCGPEQEDIA